MLDFQIKVTNVSFGKTRFAKHPKYFEAALFLKDFAVWSLGLLLYFMLIYSLFFLLGPSTQLKTSRLHGGHSEKDGTIIITCSPGIIRQLRWESTATTLVLPSLTSLQNLDWPTTWRVYLRKWCCNVLLELVTALILTVILRILLQDPGDGEIKIPLMGTSK